MADPEFYISRGPCIDCIREAYFCHASAIPIYIKKNQKRGHRAGGSTGTWGPCPPFLGEKIGWLYRESLIEAWLGRSLSLGQSTGPHLKSSRSATEEGDLSPKSASAMLIQNNIPLFITLSYISSSLVSDKSKGRNYLLLFYLSCVSSKHLMVWDIMCEFIVIK